MPTNMPTIVPADTTTTASRENTTQVPFIELPVIQGVFNLQESIGIVIGIAFILCLVIGAMCFYVNKHTRKQYENQEHEAMQRYVDQQIPFPVIRTYSDRINHRV